MEDRLEPPGVEPEDTAAPAKRRSRATPAVDAFGVAPGAGATFSAVLYGTSVDVPPSSRARS